MLYTFSSFFGTSTSFLAECHACCKVLNDCIVKVVLVLFSKWTPRFFMNALCVMQGLLEILVYDSRYPLPY